MKLNLTKQESMFRKVSNVLYVLFPLEPPKINEANKTMGKEKSKSNRQDASKAQNFRA
jgi:hypothetical protein